MPKKLGKITITSIDNNEEEKKTSSKPAIKKLQSADDGGFQNQLAAMLARGPREPSAAQYKRAVSSHQT